MTETRIRSLENVYNFRDYGGYAIPGAGRLRTGVLLRSALLEEATDADAAYLGGLQIKAVVDMRGAGERASLPDRRLFGDDVRMIRASAETVDPARAAATAAGPAKAARVFETVEDARAMMRAIYAAMPYDPTIVKLLAAFFRALAAGEGASLINCMAGKDRTGVAVAILQNVLGVHGDDRVADYVASNSQPGWEAWVERTRSRFAAMGLAPPQPVIETILLADPSLLASTFTMIADRSGSVEAYVREEVGIADDLLEALRARLIV